jgi:hypothetical protein
MRRAVAVILTLVVALAWLATSAPGAAQGVPAVAPSVPGFIQRGACDATGAPVAALAAAGSDLPSAPPDAQPIASPSPLPTAIPGLLPVAASVTVVPLRLDQLTAVEHVVRMVGAEDRPDDTVACGRIAGRPDAAGNLYVGLAAADGSGVWGVAWLQADGGSTTVTVFLFSIPADPDEDSGAAPSDGAG